MSPPSQLHQLTALSLEALSLSSTFSSTLPLPYPNSLPSLIPSNVPLPPSSPRSAHIHRLLRAIVQILHSSLHSHDHVLLLHSIHSIHALALVSPPYRSLLAHLGVVRLLPPAFLLLAPHQPQRAARILHCLSAVLRAGGLAVAHFAASKAVKPLLQAWHRLHPAPEDVVVALVRCITLAVPALPPSALDGLVEDPNLLRVRETLVRGRQLLQNSLVRHVFAWMTSIVDALKELREGEGRAVPTGGGIVQGRIREMLFLDEALAALLVFEGHLEVVKEVLAFLRAAVEGNVQNIVALGAARETHALELILRTVGTCVGTIEAEKGENLITDVLCAVVDLCVECARVTKNFETLVQLGLTVHLMTLLPRVHSSSFHVQRALELLSRCVKSSEEEARIAGCQGAPGVLVGLLGAHRHDANVQAEAIECLGCLIEGYEKNREDACQVHVIEAVHFALTEHSKEAHVVAKASRLLLQFTPLQLMQGNLHIAELKKLVKARFKMHRDDAHAAIAIDDLATALDLISQQSVRAIDEFLRVAPEKSGGLTASSLSGIRMRSSRGVTGSSFRMSFHRRTKQGKGHSGEEKRRRRVRSDFSAEVERTKNDTLEMSRSHRLRVSRLREKTWMDNSRPRGGFSVHEVERKAKPEDEAAYDPLLETLARYREMQQETKSHGSLLYSSPGQQVSVGHAERVERQYLTTRVEKRAGPIVRKQHTETMRLEDLGLDIVDSDSERSTSTKSGETLCSISGSEDEAASGVVSSCNSQERYAMGDAETEDGLSSGSSSDEETTPDGSGVRKGMEGSEDSGQVLKKVREALEMVGVEEDGISAVSPVTNSDSGEGELVMKSVKFGERERVRSESARNSGNWGAGIVQGWSVTTVSESAMERGRQTRGESGSLGMRKSG